ncbi:tetratricopeptide repeat protein [Tautonia sociabilis]|uniref:Tetratricopeptide repeat protein n=1 Tax=Tautonia sociabilis TaxID=2080755 RepID=A0A432MDQ2_9BACT|nr:tetratricopeptide repeat protein [Tautonia sociabilis]RUL82963.1 tetratricopeptide repeat protein [Tautonia sociabilis]
MPRRFWIAALSLWPGLPQVWSGQEVMGLILAGVFAATLNAAIVTHAIWTEAVSPAVSTFVTALAAGTWAAGLAYTLWWVWRCHPERYRAEIERLYREATEHYLRGRWNDARRRLEQILTMDETDADALMQLGTLYLHTGQPDEARRAFRQCLELEGGVKWRWEIAQAIRLLDRG